MIIEEIKAWILLTTLYMDIRTEVLKENRTIISKD
jgi:hypothetical protein